jgi:hypothetical protein
MALDFSQWQISIAAISEKKKGWKSDDNQLIENYSY